MARITKALSAVALAGALALGGSAAAAAAPYYLSPAWRAHHHHFVPHHPYPQRWSHRHDYRPYYYGDNYGYDPGAAVASGFIGSVFGLIAGEALAHSGGGGSHVARCEHAYRSYVASTNTYTGYDGQKHACTL